MFTRNSFTHNLVTTLSEPCHTHTQHYHPQLCRTQHNPFIYNSFTHTHCHPHSSFTPNSYLHIHNSLKHNFVTQSSFTHNFFTTHFSHPTLSHSFFTQSVFHHVLYPFCLSHLIFTFASCLLEEVDMWAMWGCSIRSCQFLGVSLLATS